MNIRLGFVANSRVLIVLFPTNKMLVVTNIVIEKHCDEVLLRSHNVYVNCVESPLDHKSYNTIGCSFSRPVNFTKFAIFQKMMTFISLKFQLS